MKTRDEFIRKWRNHLAGLALYGTVSDVRDSALARAAKVMDIPTEVERLLGLMYADLAPEQTAASNGTTAAQHQQARKA